MEKKNLALAILIICFLCFVLGIFIPQKKTIDNNVNMDNALLQSVEPVGAKIALLNIEGAISASSSANTWTNEFSLDNFLASLERVTKDNSVKAVIIRINSPGGTVAASQDIYDAVMRLRAAKPVIVSMADVAASGGYYIASAADRIVAQRGTMTGSIGVIFNFMDVAQLADKLGVNSNVIKSGQFKDSGSMYRKMTSAEEQLFQTSVNNAYSQFITAIENGRVKRSTNYDVEKRDLSLATLKKYADGRVFLGEEAYKLGFVDALGSQYDAAILANRMIGSNKDLPVVSYNKMSGLKSILLGMENRFNMPFKELLPVSFKYNNMPIMVME